MIEENGEPKNSDTLKRFKEPLDYSRMKPKNSPFLSGWVDENANRTTTPEKHAQFVEQWKEEIRRLLKGDDEESTR